MSFLKDMKRFDNLEEALEQIKELTEDISSLNNDECREHLLKIRKLIEETE